jgi:tRNA G18 (ribose-2'-O)-methylase SpoU
MINHKLVPIFCEHGGDNVFTINWKDIIGKIIENGFEPCIVMGNEGNGIPEVILMQVTPLNGHLVSIPQKGVIRSFNVSSAFSIISSQMVNSIGWL